jgi:hypothetical protein
LIYASEYNISTGSLSHILEQLQNKIGVFKANNLRKLIPAASININKGSPKCRRFLQEICKTSLQSTSDNIFDYYLLS